MRRSNRRTRTRRGVTLVVLGVWVVAGCAGSPEPAATSPTSAITRPARAGTVPAVPVFEPTPIRWEPCEEPAPEQAGDYQCGTLSVPLDYANPRGEKVNLALKRRVADDPTNRIGTMFINPGGPGSSGVDAVPSFVAANDADVSRRFDLLGWDPRGVGRSGRLPCDDTILEYFATDLTKAAPVAPLDAAAKRWADQCARSSVAAHVGTADGARDLETLRRAVGDPTMNYVGISYGSEIGLVYADFYPDKVRAMIIDGVVNIARSHEDIVRIQTDDWGNTINHFLDWCASAGSDCAFGPDPRARLQALLARLATAPQTVDVDGKSVVVGPTLVLMSTINVGAGKKALAQHLADADGGDLRWFAAAGAGATEAFGAGVFMQCADLPLPRGDAYQPFVESEAADDPIVGALGANWNRPCAYWGVPADPLPRDYRAEGSAPIMVWGNTGDTVTPYRDAVDAAKQLSNARLVTLDADQHVAMGANDCVRRIQAAYLVDLEVPPEGTRC